MEYMKAVRYCIISIHALREEGDWWPHPPSRRCQISIHALREEGDARNYICRRFLFQFLSTPSARRATACAAHISWQRSISIHALREEGDLPLVEAFLGADGFLSTPSARRATT